MRSDSRVFVGKFDHAEHVVQLFKVGGGVWRFNVLKTGLVQRLIVHFRSNLGHLASYIFFFFCFHTFTPTLQQTSGCLYFASICL